MAAALPEMFYLTWLLHVLIPVIVSQVDVLD